MRDAAKKKVAQAIPVCVPGGDARAVEKDLVGEIPSFGQGVGEQLLYLGAAIVPGWKADGVHHDQIDPGALWAWAEVGRPHMSGAGMPALGPAGRRCHG